ncbi:MAG: hypothetical protein K8U03_23150 [Planctomycetia bacterium]|nr:hypothetical protein [Planctomycetia bacterium]
MRRTLLTLALTLNLSLPAFAADNAKPSNAKPLAERHAQASYILSNAEVEVAVTKTGGHLTATFARGTDKPINPYHVSPWQTEGLKIEPAILRVLRGDFFCLPFGGNGEAFNGEQHPPHGETANADWTLDAQEKEGNINELRLSLEPKVRSGKVVKVLWLVEGQPVVYSSHVVTGFVGPAPVAHHATLALPEKEGAVRVSTSPLRFGLTNPTQFSDPAKKEYQALAIGAKFTDLKQVPQLAAGAPPADCTSFPARKGFADLLCVVNKEPAAGDETPAWVAAVDTEAGSLWFALKDPKVLPTTLFWMENGGRHGSPWLGRNNCLGLEDACAYFADGLAASAGDNLLTKAGVKTAITFQGERATTINYIQGAVRVPAGFDIVDHVDFTPQSAKFTSASGKEVTVPVSTEFLRFGKKAFP